MQIVNKQLGQAPVETITLELTGLEFEVVKASLARMGLSSFRLTNPRIKKTPSRKHTARALLRALGESLL